MTLLLLSSLASAGDLEVSAEVGRIDLAQGDWDLFDWNSTQATTGLRLEWHQSSRLAFSASYGHFVAGAHNSTWDYWDYEDTYTGPGATEGFDAAFRGHMIGLGVRGGVDLWSWLNPYANLELRGLQGVVRLDDDPYDDDNPNQITIRGTTVGAVAALGLDIRLAVRQGWAISHHLEMGYEVMAPLNLDEIGKLSFRGFHVRSGLGLRF